VVTTGALIGRLIEFHSTEVL